MNEWHETSIARAKPSRDVSVTRPCKSRVGADAIECSTKSSRVHHRGSCRHFHRGCSIGGIRWSPKAPPASTYVLVFVDPGHGELGTGAKTFSAAVRMLCCWQCRPQPLRPLSNGRTDVHFTPATMWALRPARLSFLPLRVLALRSHAATAWAAVDPHRCGCATSFCSAEGWMFTRFWYVSNKQTITILWIT